MTKNTVPLSTVKKGNRCLIKKLFSNGKKRNRLLDLGIVKGGEIEVLYSSPFGSPVAYYVQGAVIALRREDTDEIFVEIL
ncbi:MAG: FeoA family protein [bacterium]|nr:ferrous iron transport protein A [bacterium]MDD6225519.1 FeoA family protein [bacterium]MDY3861430.1 FeoA family protein [Ruminococcus sp.]